MKYLITGGAGFIGSHLSDALLKAEHHVTVLDNFSTGKFENVQHLDQHPQFQVIAADVRERETVRDCVKNCDRVFHLASAVGVKLVVDRPVHTIETIVEGTSSVLAACYQFRRPVLITSTSEVYGKQTKVPFNEDDDSVIGPPSRRRWCYASAKAIDEFLGLAYWHECRLPIVLVRLFNTVGPRQTGQYGMVIPRFIDQALKGEPLTVYGDGQQSRCFTHVADVVSALTAVLGPEHTRGQLFNIGSDREISIDELARLVIERTGSTSEIRHIPYREAYGVGFEDMQRRVPDISKIRAAIGYTPKRDLDDIIDDCIAYAREKLSDKELSNSQML